MGSEKTCGKSPARMGGEPSPSTEFFQSKGLLMGFPNRVFMRFTPEMWGSGPRFKKIPGFFSVPAFARFLGRLRLHRKLVQRLPIGGLVEAPLAAHHLVHPLPKADRDLGLRLVLLQPGLLQPLQGERHILRLRGNELLLHGGKKIGQDFVGHVNTQSQARPRRKHRLPGSRRPRTGRECGMDRRAGFGKRSNMCRWTLLLRLSWALVSPGAVLAAPEAPPAKAAIVVPSSVARDLDEPLARYRANVLRHHGVDLIRIDGNWSSPEELRATLADLHRNRSIQGAVLVGDLPMHRFRMHDAANPNPLFYEDYTLEFIDRDGDGVDEHYRGKPQLKLWIANLRVHAAQGEHDVPGLRSFLAKTDAFYSGSLLPEKAALIVAGADWKGSPGDLARRHLDASFGVPNLTLLEPPDLGKTAMAGAIARRRHALLNFQVHSSESEQDLEHAGDAIRPDNIARDYKRGATFIANHGCSSCNWLKSRAAGTPNISITWLRDTELTQAVAGNVRVGMIYGIDRLYDSLAAGDPLGEAYRKGKQTGEDEMHRQFPDGTVISGVVLLGNPFVNPLRGPFAP